MKLFLFLKDENYLWKPKIGPEKRRRRRIAAKSLLLSTATADPDFSGIMNLFSAPAKWLRSEICMNIFFRKQAAAASPD